MIGKTFALAAAGAIALTGGALAPTQSDAELSPTQVADLEQMFVEYHVPQGSWQGLLDAIEAGQPVDAQTEAAPLTTEPFERDDMVGTISRWADGSFAASLEEEGIVVHEDQMIPMGISGCTRYSSAGGTSSTNCTIQETVFNVTTSFQANYWQSPRQSSITRAWNYNATVVGGSWTFQHLRITKGTSYANAQPATAELVLMVSILGSNSRTWLQLSVGPSAVTIQKNY